MTVISIPVHRFSIVIHVFTFSGPYELYGLTIFLRGPRWLSGRASDSGARGPGFEPHDRGIVSLSKTLSESKSTGKYPGSGGSVPK